jgi:putative PIN family toxin of toxin-antitoxin system
VPIVAVFDTNVLFSAVGWKGAPYRCLELARSGAVQGAICQELVDEFSEKLQSKLLFSPSQALESVIDLLTFLRLAPITGQLKVVPADPNDDKVLECAVLTGATHIVTGDRKHLIPLRKFQQVEIVTPAEFLAIAAMQ